MATVYAGHDLKLERTVALKVMHATLADDEGFVRRFIGEAKHAAALSHPNVVAVYDQGADRGHVFLAMEYVHGRTVRDLLTERGRLGPRQALRVMRPVLAALGAAHRAGLIHRDVKPENVLLTADGQVKVTDFGLARAETESKQTKTGILIGTVGYLAPEQVLSGDADTRTDVYAAGIMLFELLTGHQPYQGGTPLAVAYKHVNETVPPPSSMVPGLPPQLDALVTSATDRDPSRRPAHADHFHAAVDEVYRTLPPDIDTISASNAPTPPPGRERRAPLAERATQNLSASEQNGAARTMALPLHEAPPSAPRKRLRRSPILYGLLAAGVGVALLAGLFWVQTARDAQRVPRLVGLSEEDARLQANKLGLKVKVGLSRYDADVPRDKVANVTPSAGTHVKKGTLVTLILSRGQRPVAVPDVRDQPLQKAKQRLQQAGLRPGDQVQQYSGTVQPGYVITTRPPAGSKDTPDKPVTIVVSGGMKMPDLTNLTAHQAARELARLGVNVQWQQQAPAGGRPPNTVIGQNPPAGEPINRGDDVQVTVTNAAGNCGWWNPFCGQGNNGDNRDNGGSSGRSNRMPGNLDTIR
jgi:eukaryotic-like serine/threonine-protein kinase